MNNFVDLNEVTSPSSATRVEPSLFSLSWYGRRYDSLASVALRCTPSSRFESYFRIDEVWMRVPDRWGKLHMWPCECRISYTSYIFHLTSSWRCFLISPRALLAFEQSCTCHVPFEETRTPESISKSVIQSKPRYNGPGYNGISLSGIKCLHSYVNSIGNISKYIRRMMLFESGLLRGNES